MAGEGPVLGGVDEALGVLDAGPHGKGLGLQGQAQAVQELEHVPGAVAHRQDGLGALDGLPLAPGLHLQAGEVARLGPDARHLSGKAHLAPQGDDLLPDAAHHPGQPVGADVGLGVGEDLFRGPGFHQLLQHLADAGVPGAGGELPVGEGAGAPLAKLHVALRVQNPPLPEGFYALLPLLHGQAPLQHQGALAALGQDQPGEEACRAQAHHHRALRELRPLRQVVAVGLPLAHPVVPQPGEELVLPVHLGLDGADEADVLFLPGVHGFFRQPHPVQGLLRHPQALGRRFPQIGLGEAQF